MKLEEDLQKSKGIGFYICSFPVKPMTREEMARYQIYLKKQKRKNLITNIIQIIFILFLLWWCLK